MTTLYQLADRTEPGDRIRWQAEKGDTDDPEPRTVSRIVSEVGKITIETDGPRGGDASFWVEEGGENRAFFGGQNMGRIEWVELVDKEIVHTA